MITGQPGGCNAAHSQAAEFGLFWTSGPEEARVDDITSILRLGLYCSREERNLQFRDSLYKLTDLSKVVTPQRVNREQECQKLNSDSSSNNPLNMDGLWDPSFRSDTTNGGLAAALYFSAGSDGEAHSLFGSITPIQNTPDNAQ